MENKARKTALPAAAADYTLLMKRLEQAVLKDHENPKCRAMLAKQEIWENLSCDQALAWAGLAQIAGMADTALAVHETILAEDPGSAPAWKAHIELLDILDRRQELASAVKRAENHLPSGEVRSWVSPGSRGGPVPGNKDFEGSKAPFEHMHTRQRRLSNFLTLFAGRKDVFARQWADRDQGKSGYVPVRRPFSIPDLEEHLKGTKTYGFYLMDIGAMVTCGVIDADLTPEFRPPQKNRESAGTVKKEQTYLISRIRETSRAMGLFPVIEISGNKGFHFWYFMEKPAPAAQVRKALQRIKDSLSPDLSCFCLEVFPKQDHLSGKGLGNLVKMPLGIHRVSGKRSFFPECAQKDPDAQLAFLEGVKRSDPDKIKDSLEEPAVHNLVIHPEFKALSEKYPGLFELEKNCPALGQITASVRESHPLSAREEKILFQTLGFLPEGRKILHFLLAKDPDYNPHMVDYKLSRVRGTPLGCRRIHSLTGFSRDFCRLTPDSTGYIHPLIHLKEWGRISEKKTGKSEKIENLTQAVENMKMAIIQLEKFLS